MMEDGKMKRLFTLLLLASCFAACTTDIQPETAKAPAPESYTLIVNATKGDGPATKALSLDGKTLKATWTTGDKVSVYIVKGEGATEMESYDPVGTLTAQRSGASTTMKGTFTGYKPVVGEKLRLRFLSSNYTGQKGTLDYIAANCDYAIADVSISDVSGDVVSTTSATFANQQAIVKFSLKKQDGTTPVAASSLTLKVGSLIYDVALDTPSSEVFVALPQVNKKDIVLVASTADGGFGCEQSGVTFERGKYYAISVHMATRAMFKMLTDVTESEIGWRVGSDGMAYEPAGNLPTGVSAVAMIGYVSGTGHGLAIELNNSPSKAVWEDASATAIAGKPRISGGTWRLPSFDDWFNIITSCSVEGDATSFPAVGETALNPIRGFEQKWLATGFKFDPTQGRAFWTSTTVTDAVAWSVFLDIAYGQALAWFAQGNMISSNYVLACLEF